MTKQINDKTMLIISLISFVATLLCITYMIISGNFKAENCWDKYSTEQEAILNCEGEN